MCERGTHKLAIHTMPNPNSVTIIIWPKQTHQTYTTPNSPKMLDKNKVIPARHSLSSPSDSEMIWCIWFVFLVMINKITLSKKTPKVQFLLFWGWRTKNKTKWPRQVLKLILGFDPYIQMICFKKRGSSRGSKRVIRDAWGSLGNVKGVPEG